MLQVNYSMEQQIAEVINNSESWRNFKTAYISLQQISKEYVCGIVDSMAHMQQSNVNIIRFVVNNKYEAKINITNNESEIMIRYYYNKNNNKWIIEMPFYIMLAKADNTMIDDIDDEFAITKVYKNFQLDISDHDMFMRNRSGVIGDIEITNVELLITHLEEMTKIFVKIVDKCM